MKNKFFKFSAVALTAALMAISVSCKEDKEDPTLAVTPWDREVVFEADGTTANPTTFTVTTNQSEWDAQPIPTWVKVNKSGNTFTLSAAEVTGTTAPPDAKVTVTAGSATPIEIVVKQKAKTVFYLDLSSTEDVTITADGKIARTGTLVYTVDTDASSWDAESDQTSWLTITNKTANGFMLSAKANESEQPRTATVAVSTTGAYPVEIQVTQNGFGWTDISSVVLVNYEEPFPSGDGWTVINLPGSFHLYQGWLSASYWSDPPLVNAKVYQIVELEPGTYKLSLSIHTNTVEPNYLATALGVDLPDVDDIEQQALAFVLIPFVGNADAGQTFSIEFDLTEENTVSLGTVFTIHNSAFYIKKLELSQKN